MNNTAQQYPVPQVVSQETTPNSANITTRNNNQTTTVNVNQVENAINQVVVNTTTTNNKTGQTTNTNQVIQTTNTPNQIANEIVNQSNNNKNKKNQVVPNLVSGEVLAETTNTNLPSLLSQEGYKKMGEFLNLAGLTQKLSDAPHTVFAPSDKAWNQFLKREANVNTNDKAKKKMNQVLQNNKQKEQFLEKLRGILFFHVVPGKMNKNTPNSANTSFIQQPNLISTDLLTVHGIDAVLIPESSRTQSKPHSLKTNNE
jgi:hypothetical protein